MVLLTFTLNSNNCTDSITYSRFRYTFSGGGIKLNKGAKICVTQIILPYSWYNISVSNSNNSFSYKWIGTTYSVTIPSGYYSVDTLNLYLQQVMYSNGHYLYNTSTGNNVYYINIQSNQTYYSNTITCYLIPTSLPTNYTNPASLSFPSSAQTPQVIIGSNSFGSLIGFTSGTYPSTAKTSSYNVNSNTIPNITPVNGIVCRTSLVDNKSSYITDILDTFYINDTTFGSNINYQPSYRKWLSAVDGDYHHFDIYFSDQNYNVIVMNDNNTLISIQIDNPDVIDKNLPIKNNIKKINFDDDEEKI